MCDHIYQDKILKIIQHSPYSYLPIVKNDKDLWTWIASQTKNLPIDIREIERVYCAAHNLSSLPVCIRCGGSTTFITIRRGYTDTCSFKCHGLNKMKYTHDTYIQYLQDNDVSLDIIEPYTNITTPTLHKCKKCDRIFKIRPTTVILGQRCFKCHCNSITKTPEQYLADILDKAPRYTPLEPYVTAKTKILHRHDNCGYEWLIRPNDILTGYGCPSCNTGGIDGVTQMGKPVTYKNITFDSMIEHKCALKIEEYINFEDIDFHKRYNKYHKSTCDFYLKDYDYWIEVSSYNNSLYLDKIYIKRQRVENFFFAQNPVQLEIFLEDLLHQIG